MTVMDPEGQTWARVAEAAAIVAVRPDLIRQWVARGHVRAQYTLASVWVNLGDVQDRERRWRVEGRWPGRPRVAGDPDGKVSH